MKQLILPLLLIITLTSCQKQLLVIQNDAIWTLDSTSALTDAPSMEIRLHTLQGRNLGSRKIFVQEIDTANGGRINGPTSLLSAGALSIDNHGNAFIVTNSQGRASVRFTGPLDPEGIAELKDGAMHSIRFSYGKRNMKKPKSSAPACVAQVRLYTGKGNIPTQLKVVRIAP